MKAARVRRGETLAGHCRGQRVSLNQLLAANGWSGTRELLAEKSYTTGAASRAEASVAGAADAATIGGRCHTAPRRWCSPNAT